MAELKTQRNKQSVVAYLNSLEDAKKKSDAFVLLELFEDVCGLKGEMWGDSIIGFGSYHYQYASGQEGDWMLVGFAPRKQNLTLYLMTGAERHAELLTKLGKHKTSKGSCLYIKQLKDVDMAVLREIISRSFKLMNKKYNGED
ncbi:MAG: DUF1801 domain-containing protein [Bacteroidetes bacterium]|nr:DUF1801 domain-containing protein [Bacteroidota bacterium]